MCYFSLSSDLVDVNVRCEQAPTIASKNIEGSASLSLTQSGLGRIANHLQVELHLHNSAAIYQQSLFDHMHPWMENAR